VANFTEITPLNAELTVSSKMGVNGRTMDRHQRDEGIKDAKNTHTKKKPEPKPTDLRKNCSYDHTPMWYTMQHRTVLIIFPLIFQTILTAQMLSSGGQLDINSVKAVIM